MPDLITVAKWLIAIPSSPPHGTRRLITYLTPLCEAVGLHVTRVGSKDPGRPDDVNLIASTLPAGSPDLCPQGVALLTHLDTVPPGDPALWTETGGDPCRPTRKGDRLYGLGSADTKLDFLCKLEAIKKVGVKKRSLPVVLIGTFGEEEGLLGARLLQEKKLLSPRLALVGEPSELKPIIAHKGFLYMRATHTAPLSVTPNQSTRQKTFTGRGAHGATPELGDNAILKGLNWFLAQHERHPDLELLCIQGGTAHNMVPDFCSLELTQARTCSARVAFLEKFLQKVTEAESRFQKVEDPLFDPPLSTINIGLMRTSECKLTIEFESRLIPSTDLSEVVTHFTALGREMAGVTCDVVVANNPMITKQDSEIAARVREALQSVPLPTPFLTKPANTEGAILNQMGAESIVIGPGRAYGNIHSPNEYNEISELEKAVAFYTAFLQGFC